MTSATNRQNSSETEEEKQGTTPTTPTPTVHFSFLFRAAMKKELNKATPPDAADPVVLFLSVFLHSGCVVVAAIKSEPAFKKWDRAAANKSEKGKDIGFSQPSGTHQQITHAELTSPKSTVFCFQSVCSAASAPNSNFQA